MKSLIVNILCLIGIVLVTWVFISWFDIILKNTPENGYEGYLLVNFFKIITEVGSNG